MYASLTHTCDIERERHDITDRRKAIDRQPHVTDQDCNIQPLSDTSVIAVLGRTASEAYVGFFPGDADIRMGDHVIRTDADPELRFEVESVVGAPSPGFGDPHLLQAALKRTDF